MRLERILAALAILAALGGRALAADAAEDKQAKLLATLQTGQPQDKAVACKQLAIYGGKEAVPALAALLGDEQLASWARIALEAIPDPAVDAALREATGKLQGRLLIGIINSLGVRRDAQAVDLLVKKLADPDAEVASAAAVALGHIGNEPAGKALEQAAGTRSVPSTGSAVAEGLILVAERRLAEGNRAEAIRLYDLVRKSDAPKQRVLEATRGAILARQAAGAPLLAELLLSADKDAFHLGLKVSRELPGGETTQALLSAMSKAPAERKAMLLVALGDRGDAAALPAALEAARGQGEMRLVALRMLVRVGDATAVPVLLEAALDADEDASRTARDVLADLPGKAVDDDLAARLAKAEGKVRAVLIETAGRRGMVSAVPALLAAAGDADPTVRIAAIRALGATVPFDRLDVLIDRVAQTPQNADEAKAADESLRAACQRMPDREAAAEKVIAAMQKAPTAAKVRFLEVLATVGGAKSLAALAVAARDSQAEIQDAATRLLGEWMSVDAAPVLLELAKTATDPKYEVRAMRGYIRIARQFVMPEDQRVAMCRTALATAKRDQEKKLVLEVLERYPSADTLALAVEASKVPALQSDATRAGLVIAEKLGGQSSSTQQLLAQMGSRPRKIEVLKAEYGSGNKYVDVTEIVRQRVRRLPLIILPEQSYNASFGGDPTPGVKKDLRVRYKIDGKEGQASFGEDDSILLPEPQ